VFETLKDELIELCGEQPYRMLVAHLVKARQSRSENATWLPHPALKARSSRPN
jgi:hypothetical protein